MDLIGKEVIVICGEGNYLKVGSVAKVHAQYSAIDENKYHLYGPHKTRGESLLQCLHRNQFILADEDTEIVKEFKRKQSIIQHLTDIENMSRMIRVNIEEGFYNGNVPVIVFAAVQDSLDQLKEIRK